MDKKREMMVAYEVKKRNEKKAKYAEGGFIDSMKKSASEFMEKQKQDLQKVKDIEAGTYIDPTAGKAGRSGYAKGGMVEAIMAKRAEQVDIDHNNSEEPNSFYNLNEHEALEENPNDTMMDVEQPEDSNLDQPMIDKDEHDMISQIRSKMNMKRQFRDK